MPDRKPQQHNGNRYENREASTHIRVILWERGLAKQLRGFSIQVFIRRTRLLTLRVCKLAIRDFGLPVLSSFLFYCLPFYCFPSCCFPFCCFGCSPPHAEKQRCVLLHNPCRFQGESQHNPSNHEISRPGHLSGLDQKLTGDEV